MFKDAILMLEHTRLFVLRCVSGGIGTVMRRRALCVQGGECLRRPGGLGVG